MSAHSVLVVVAHPDDEVLGCGGTIAVHRAAGDRVEVLVLGDGVTSREERAGPDLLDERRRMATRANEILGVNELTLLGYPDNQMDTVPLLDIVKEIERAIERSRATVVYTHHAGDVNVDHTCTHDAAIAACRPQPGSSVRRLLFFETPSSTEWRPPGPREFVPNWFSDISRTLDTKLAALQAYDKELRSFPHPRSLAAVEHLARWRGATAGVAAAEAFQLGREIV